MAMSVNAEPKVLWEAPSAEGVLVDWGEPVYALDAADAAQIKAGDNIVITVASVDKTISEWPQAAIIDGTKGGWPPLVNSLVNEACNVTFGITYDVATKIHENGISFNGNAAYISKVVLEEGTVEVGPNTVWFGPKQCNWGDALSVNKEAFADVTPGDKIVVNYSEGVFQFILGGWSGLNLASYDVDKYSFMTAENGLVTLELVPELASYDVTGEDGTVTNYDAFKLLKENGLLIQGPSLINSVDFIHYTAPELPEVVMSVDPALDVVETLETINITFEGADEAAWAVTGTENAPYMVDVVSGERVATFFKMAAEDNVLSFGFYDEFTKKGEYQIVIPAGSYTLNGAAGPEITLKYEVLGLTGVSVEPAVNTLTELSFVKIVFNEAETVTVGELDTNNCPYIEYVNEEGEHELRHRLQAEAYGNTLFVHTFNNSAITEPGEYVVVVPGTCYFLDGEAGEDMEFIYTIVEPSYPEVDLGVTPATDVIETLDTIELTFGGVDIVKWNVTGTENAPYVVDLDGNRWATFTNLSGLGNTLSLGLASEFDVKGEYNVIIPEGSYVFGGIYQDMPGKQIVLKYEVLGVGGITVEPAVNTLTELALVKITFNEAKEVTLAEELGTLNSPYVDFVTEDGERQRRHTLVPEAHGNALFLHTFNSSPINEPGEYIVVLPGACYFLDGEAGEDIELGYTIVEPSYPEVDLSVNPATDVVETLDTIEVTFGGVDVVEWAVTGTENAPYMVDEEGNRVATFYQLSGLGNMLSMSFNDEFAMKGNYTIIIPEGSYVLQGIYRGMPGKEITLHYEVLGLGGYSVEPAVDKVTELHVITLTFNDAKTVTLAEDLGTLNCPYIDYVNEEGDRETRHRLRADVAGNKLVLNTFNNAAITEPGEYFVVIPGSTYFLDGEAGEDIELNYTILETEPEFTYTVEPSDYTLKQLDVINITFDGCEEAFWNLPGMKNEEVAYPYITIGDSDPDALKNLYSVDNILSLSREGYEAFVEPGYYVVTIPAGSYFVDGYDGKEIVLNYIIDPSAVNAIFGEKANMDVFDINGRVILRNADAEAVKSLRGIFVINGKKYILR